MWKKPSGTNKLRGLKWGVIGDSISTIGYKADGQEYPAQITERNGMILNDIAIPGSMITKSTVVGHETDQMCDRVSVLDADCDIITVAGGVNDLRNSIPIGVMGDTVNTTFYGALDVLCNNLITTFPDKPKGIFTPIKFRGNNDNLVPFVDAIKEVSAKYAIPVVDMFTVCNLQPDIDLITANYFDEVGLHPNATGHTIMSRPIESFLNSIV